MMSDHDSIIKLLNGYLNRSDNDDSNANDVFLDRHGQPTDRFLEALKADFETAIPPPESPLKRVNTSSKKTNNNSNTSTKNTTIHNRKNSKTNTSAKNISSIKGTNKKIDNDFNLELHSNSDYNYDDEDDIDDDDDNDDYSHGDYNNDILLFQSKINKKKKSTKKSALNTTKRNTITRKVNTNNTYRPTPTIIEEKAPTQVIDEAGMEAAIEAETKLRTLKLRVAGQQQTIKVLEAQLTEALQTIDIRNKQLSYTARNSSRNKENEISVRYRAKDDPVNQPMYRLNDEVQKCRKEIDDLNHKIQEEREKRLRAEDRARVLKDYAEKTKSVSQDVREKNNELQKAISEMQTRIQKYRRDCKEYAAEAVAQKTIALERDGECNKHQIKAANADEKLRSVTLELSRSKEEIRSLRKDLHHSLDQNKQLVLELDTFKQRDSARKIEMKIQQTTEDKKETSKGKPPRAPTYMKSSAKTLGSKSHFSNDKSYSRFDDLDNARDSESLSLKRKNLTSFAIEESRRSNESIGSIGSRSVGSVDSKGYRSDRSKGYPLPKRGLSLSDSEQPDRNRRQPLTNYVVRRSHDSDISFRSTVSFNDKPTYDRPSSAPTSRDNSFSDNNVSHRFERLQKMYEKVTGKDSSKIVWKDSSSSDDE